jgi:hypothetical protein
MELRYDPTQDIKKNELIREHCRAYAAKTVMMESTSTQAKIDAIRGRANKRRGPRGTWNVSHEVAKNIRQGKRTAVDFAPCLDTKGTPGSLPEEQTREPLFIWETMEPDERRKFLMAYFVSKLNLKEWIEEKFAEKLAVMQQCWAIEEMPSEIETQE